MTSLRVATRRAVPAAFLLFAAVLFVVGPAEASLTTTDPRTIVAPSRELPSTSRELASLELLPPAPVDPAESSPRFSFAEDLGLLDPEAGPGGFVVFAREPNRCELTYARNNPLKYVDPDGRAIETFVDVGMAAISIKQAIKSPTFWNIAGAVLDVGAVLTPFVPAVGGRVIDAVQAGDKLVDAAKAARVSENAAQGAAFEAKVVEQLGETQTGIVQQLTVKTQSGTRTRLDAAGRAAGGDVALTEAKSSATARLTPKQKAAFPEIATSGATVVGRGKPGFPGGTEIPPTTVRVVRPDDLPR